MKFILGLKLGTSQIFDENGNVIPVTLVEAGPCHVAQIKTKDKDGYEAIQLGFLKLNEKKVKKPNKLKPYRYIKEFRGDIDLTKYKVKDKVDVSVFQEGDKVEVSGITKGKGFAGVVKKWRFKGKMATHGTKHEERGVGSVGSRYPQRVIKGKKMPGRMGSERVTIKNLKIAFIDEEKKETKDMIKRYIKK